MTGPRDWDKELAEIDRLIQKTPAGKAEGAEGAARAGGVAGTALPSPARSRAALPAAPRGRGEIWGAWGRVLLGAVLGVAVTQWPYAHDCGAGLFLYLSVVAMVPLAGFWSAVVSWRRRMGLAHLMSIGIVFWGFAVAAGAILPRLGYARQSLGWLCP